MNVAPIAAWLTSSLASLLTLAIPLVGLALFIAGVYWALGNHNHGRDRAIAAMIGGAIMLSAQTLASAIHI
jgi:VIT1/CCC1 family predicted Fe2+/Mn2+ transporter